MGAEWIDTTIGEQVLLQRGIDITRAAQRSGSVPVISSGGVSSFHDTPAAKGPGVILGRKGVVGSVYYVEEDYWPHDTTLWVRDFKGNHPRFVYYFFKQRSLELARLDVGSANPTLNRNHVHPTPVRWPPVATQRVIACILGTLDDKIELNRRTNETLEAMARALFKSWFVDFDSVRAKAEGRQPSGMDAKTAKLFPSEFEESELGEIPKRWRATTLGAEAERCGGVIQTGPFGSQLHASDYVPEGVPVVMPKDISARRVSTTDIARIREEDAERLSRHRLLVGDIVYSRRGDVERHALIGERETGWLCGTGCLLVRLGPNWPSPLFASMALDRPQTRAWITQHAIGATMPNLNTGILAAVPVVVPPDSIIAAFAIAADQLQALVVSRDIESATLAKTRDALLPRLLSGELPVGGTERVLEAQA
ncbi:MAG: restriction endonuclease subunit S [Myxococcales bacterium]|nr:restriction endonuclease subunit S [Myxococcales bacterium]